MSEAVEHAAVKVSDPDRALWQVLADHVAEVDDRLSGSGAYSGESAEVRSAALEVPVLRRALGLGPFVADLTPRTGKPQYLLEFSAGAMRSEVAPGVTCVLKVYGRSRPAEASLQSEWSEAGIPTPRIFRFGDSPVSWLVMELVRATPFVLRSTDEILALTHEMAELMCRVHERGEPSGDVAQSLTAGVMIHLETVTAVLISRGYDVPPDWRQTAAEGYALGTPTTLHGDLFPGNLLNSERGALLIDTCGYLGDAAFDAARWAVRVATPDCPSEAVCEAWAESEPALDRGSLRSMLALESLMQAGVREIVKAETGQPAGYPDQVTLKLLADFAEPKVRL